MNRIKGFRNLGVRLYRRPIRHLHNMGAQTSLFLALLALILGSIIQLVTDVGNYLYFLVGLAFGVVFFLLSVVFYLIHQTTNGRRSTPANATKSTTEKNGSRQKPNFASASPLNSKLTDSPIRTVLVSDKFTADSIEHWAELHHLTPSNYQQLIDDVSPDLLLIESAWKGVDGAWQGKLRNGASDEIRELIKHAKSKEVPVVFWNKEDPVHFEAFIDVAKLADLVLTTDSNCVDLYKQRGVTKIRVAGFGVNPLVHNLIGATNDIKSAVYSGSFYSKFAARSAKVRAFLGAIPQHLLTIFDRNSGNANYSFPEELSGSIRQGLPYRELLMEQKRFVAGLNFDTVTESPTMFSRRVVELMASGVPVISSPSMGLSQLADKNLIRVANYPENMHGYLRYLSKSPHIVQKTGLRASRFAIKNFDTQKTLAGPLSEVGVVLPSVTEPSVTIFTSTNRLSNLDHLIKQVSRQKYKVIAKFALGFHGVRPNMEELTFKLQSAGLDEITRVTFHDKEESLGNVYNTITSNCNTDMYAKFDDDDCYLPNYLLDQITASRFSGAQLVGKKTVLLNLVDGGFFGLKYPGCQNQFTDFVHGPTFLISREALSIGFSDRTKGEDSDFLRRTLLEGGTIYSSDYFNFVVNRKTEGHTYKLSQEQILWTLEFAGFGNPESYARC